MLKKQTILQIKNIYTANAFSTNAGNYIGAGSETEPVVKLYDFVSGKTEEVSDCPGGMMSFVPVPGEEEKFVTIMGLFPPFIGTRAGLYLHRRSNNGWETVKTMDLPFAHRCEFLKLAGRDYLVAASVSKYKKDPTDWTLPGEVHVVPVTEMDRIPWRSTIIPLGITRNHGMCKAKVEGSETVLVSGADGIFAVVNEPGDGWGLRRIFDKEVSEITFIDLDGDGNDELATIEAFHGSSLNIYKKSGENWELKFTSPLSFGHGLSSGYINDLPVIIAGNRSDSLALEIFTADKLAEGSVKKRIIEEGAGPTQTQVISFGGENYIMSANQKKNEVALYSGDPWQG